MVGSLSIFSKYGLLSLFYDRFAIPFTLATTLGLAAVALRGDPAMKVLTPADVSAGLPAAAAASALLGQSGAVALLILLLKLTVPIVFVEFIALSLILIRLSEDSDVIESLNVTVPPEPALIFNLPPFAMYIALAPVESVLPLNFVVFPAVARIFNVPAL